MSAITDGILIRIECANLPVLDEMVAAVGEIYQLDFEKVFYSKVARRDINNYLAVEEHTGKLKLKGCFKYDPDDITTKRAVPIIVKAAQQLLLNDIPVEQAVRASGEIRGFTCYFAADRDSKVIDGAGNRLKKTSTGGTRALPASSSM